MRVKTIPRNQQDIVHVMVFETGDKVVAEITAYVKKRNIRAARFTAIGAMESALLAFFDWEKKDYLDIPVKQQTEVLILAGDIAWEGDEPVVHAHVVLGKPDGSTCGGHLKEARVRPTLELFLEESGALRRRHDPRSGLALIDLSIFGGSDAVGTA